jgi:Zn-dependent protease with chaperone function
MRRTIWIILLVPLVLIIMVAVGTAATIPTARHIASAFCNVPDYLPALADNGHVHFEPGAEDYGREVSALLPAALTQIEAAQGRPFAHPVTIGVYATSEKYAAANAAGPGNVGVAAFGRVVLSPTLNGPQRHRLPAILTHELSHAHLQGYLST